MNRSCGIPDANFEAVIGLEVHVQLNTRSKIFSSAPAHFRAKPNQNANLLDAGMPGTLPTLNRAAVEKAVLFGLAINADISPESRFERKSYFYPDLPKGYQITQYRHPIIQNGSLSVALGNGKEIRVGVERAHLEEDAGSSIHDRYPRETAIDLNRAGVALLEVVFAPELHRASEAAACFRELHGLVCWLGISDGVLALGSMRCDANVSIRPRGTNTLGSRTEIKNVNSFRFLEQAIELEVERQIRCLEKGVPVITQTLLFDPGAATVVPMRAKERTQDYRYMTDPDLLPVAIDDTMIERIRATMPELPRARADRYVRELGLDPIDASRLCRDRATAMYFEAVSTACGDARQASNWILGELRAALKQDGTTISEVPMSAETLASLISRVLDGELTKANAKKTFSQAFATGQAIDSIIRAHRFQIPYHEDQVRLVVRQVLKDHSAQVAQYREGKTRVFTFLVGKIMKATEGRADPEKISGTLRSELGTLD